jgi:DNA-binding phage protein
MESVMSYLTPDCVMQALASCQHEVYNSVMEHSYDLAALARNVIDAAGGTMGVARKLGYSRQRVHYWRRRGVPPKALSALHRALGIHPSTVRPDLFIDVT